MKVRDDLIAIYGATDGQIDDVTLQRHLHGLGYEERATELFQIALEAMRTNDYPKAMELLKKQR
jgi:hypothetical protein